MRVTIHQPEHFPWLGFFHKIGMADTYVVLDNVQYRRSYFQNRNKIRIPRGWQWLTVPLEEADTRSLLIKDAAISQQALRWKDKNIKSIYLNYHKAKSFEYLYSDLEAIYKKDYLSLRDFNLALLGLLFEKLGLKPKIQLASGLGVSGRKGDLIFNICKALNAAVYISGISGSDYLDLEKFKENNIEIVIQEFHHPIYKQLHEPFLPCMSVIDLLFNYGKESMDIINGIGMPVMEEVFH